MRTRRQVGRVVLCLMVALIGCSRDSGSTAKQQPEGEKLAAASVTPAFRNLGKRAESTL
jgi:hypothetical protein